MKNLITTLLASLLLISHTAATTLKATNDNASLAFSGEHAGMQFQGRFLQWQSELVLPPADNPNITASFQLASAKTGDSTYDETLPEADWFDVKQFPQARFTSTRIESIDGGFRVAGNLRLKGISKPVEFVLKASPRKLTARFDIDRLAHGIGVESDPDAEWVSQFIRITLVIPVTDSL